MNDSPDIKNARDNIRKAFSSLISDALSKGLDNIQLSDYEGLPLDYISDFDGETSLKEFVHKYVQYAGKTIQEANDLMVQAITKDNELNSTDLLKDLEFFREDGFKTSLSGLKELANKLNVDINELLDTAVIYANAALDEYYVDVNSIEDMDVSSQPMQEAIQKKIVENTRKLNNDLADSISDNLAITSVKTDLIKDL
jgi:hypothetical protein